MNSRHHSLAARQAAIADFHTSGDSATVVAARHGIGRSTLSNWVSGHKEDLGYHGGWEVRGGVRYPLLPEPRTA